MAGLQVWGPDGTMWVDTGTSVILYLGVFSIGGAGFPQNGSISDARLANGSPFAFELLGGIPSVDNLQANIAVSGTTISWAYPNADGSVAANRPASTIMYGCY